MSSNVLRHTLTATLAEHIPKQVEDHDCTLKPYAGQGLTRVHPRPPPDLHFLDERPVAGLDMADTDCVTVMVGDAEPFVETKPALLRLPTELLDDIFELVYPRDFSRQLVWRGTQNAKVSEFLVSKEYFAVAARTFIRGRTLRITRDIIPSLLRDGASILCLFCTNILADYPDRTILSKLPSMTRLQFRVTRMMMNAGLPEGVSVIDTLLSGEDFAMSEACQYVQGVAGLTSFKLVADGALMSRTNRRQRAIWEANVRAFEAYLAPLLLRKPVDTVSDLADDIKRLAH